MWVTSQRAAGARGEPAQERFNVAVVGCGGQGGENVKAVAGLGQSLVALCDVDEVRAAVALAAITSVQSFEPFFYRSYLYAGLPIVEA